MRIRASVVLAAVAVASSALPARADDSTGERTDKTDGIIVWLGGFSPDHGEPASTGNGFAFGVAWERRRQSGLRYGIEFNYFGADYRVPAGLSCGLLCSIDSTMTLDVLGIGPTVGYGGRLGPFDLYAGAGVGYYWSTMTATASVLGIPGDHSESDNNVGADLRIGLRAMFGSGRFLGVELRQLSLSGTFGLLSNNQSMAIGGRSTLVSYGWRY